MYIRLANTPSETEFGGLHRENGRSTTKRTVALSVNCQSERLPIFAQPLNASLSATGQQCHMMCTVYLHYYHRNE